MTFQEFDAIYTRSEDIGEAAVAEADSTVFIRFEGMIGMIEETSDGFGRVAFIPRTTDGWDGGPHLSFMRALRKLRDHVGEES